MQCIAWLCDIAFFSIVHCIRTKPIMVAVKGIKNAYVVSSKSEGGKRKYKTYLSTTPSGAAKKALARGRAAGRFVVFGQQSGLVAEYSVKRVAIPPMRRTQFQREAGISSAKQAKLVTQQVEAHLVDGKIHMGPTKCCGKCSVACGATPKPKKAGAAKKKAGKARK